MWGSAIIVFREIFEIAIILCVVLAATKGITHRGKWISAGIAGGAIGALFFAALTQSLALLSGTAGKQYFNAGILLTAVMMIGWTVIWMKKQSKDIVRQLNQVSKAVESGTKPLYLLSVVIGLAVLREGSEIVIFLYGLIAAGQTTWLTIFTGGLIGLALGIICGFLMYIGLLRLSIKYLFQITSVLLTLIAAGMAANAGGKLVHAGLLPSLIQSVWNTSGWLPQHSLLGRFLSILIGYQENPNGMQLCFYLITLSIIVFAVKLNGRVTPLPQP